MKNKIFFLLASAILLTVSIGFAADTYIPDKGHSSVGFTVTHMLISKVNGRFNDFDAVVVYDPQDITKSSLSGKIKSASITTDNENRDADLKSDGFFDVEKYPEIVFQSTKVEKKGKDLIVTGNLTIHGVTKPVMIPVTLNGPVKLGNNTKMGIEANFIVNRQDYGISWNKKLDNGGAVVSDEVKISINAELKKQEATQ
jgi:polyisoprenoid-binding protein YceI